MDTGQYRCVNPGELVTALASSCPQLKTLAVGMQSSRTSGTSPVSTFPVAVSRLTALESLALQYVQLLVCNRCQDISAPSNVSAQCATAYMACLYYPRFAAHIFNATQ